MFKNVLGLITNPNDTFIRINQESKIPGIIIGIVVALFAPYVNLILRIQMGMPYSTDIKTLVIVTIQSVLSFILCISFVYLMCRLFKGGGKYLSLSSNIGWATVPSIVASFTFIFLCSAENLMQTFPIYKNAIMMLAIICPFLMVAELIWTIKVAIISISISMSLSKFKSTVIYLLSIVISIILYKMYQI